MRLRVLFVRWPDDEAVMPNAFAVVDDFMEAEHGDIPVFYADQRAALEAQHGAANVAEMFVTIPNSAVEHLWATPTVAAAEVGAAHDRDPQQ